LGGRGAGAAAFWMRPASYCSLPTPNLILLVSFTRKLTVLVVAACFSARPMICIWREWCWDIHSAPVCCVISPTYTVNSLVVSSISGIYYYYLCYLLRYLMLFLFLFVYKDIHYASYLHASVHTLVSICHTVSHKSDMRLALLFTDFSTLHPITVSLFYYAVQPRSLVFSHWHLALSEKNNDAFSCSYALLTRISSRSPAAHSAGSMLSHHTDVHIYVSIHAIFTHTYPTTICYEPGALVFPIL